MNKPGYTKQCAQKVVGYDTLVCNTAEVAHQKQNQLISNLRKTFTIYDGINQWKDSSSTGAKTADQQNKFSKLNNIFFLL